MKLRFGMLALFGLVMITASAMAQHPLRGPEGSGDAAGPEQPLRPQMPTITPRTIRQVPAEEPPAPPSAPKPPFTLTPKEEAEVDRVLNQWEQRGREVKTFDCGFTRWTYDLVFNPPEPGKEPTPKFTDTGVIKYAAPDRGLFKVEKTLKDKKEQPVNNARSDHWMCDGKSVFQYDPTKKQVVEHKLPAELQGKAIANSKLPFLFGAEAKVLKDRYWIRIVTPADVKNQIWLEAYPRYQREAADFHHVLFVINTEGMSPYYLRLVQPNEKDYTSYQFFDIVVNDPLRLFKGDPFRPFTPLGWQLVPDNTPQKRAPDGASPPTGRRRPKIAGCEPRPSCSAGPAALAPLSDATEIAYTVDSVRAFCARGLLANVAGTQGVPSAWKASLPDDLSGHAIGPACRGTRSVRLLLS